MIWKQKNLIYKIPREIISVKNWTQHLPFGPFKLIFFSQIKQLRTWVILTVIINIIKYCWIKGNAQMQLLKKKNNFLDETSKFWKKVAVKTRLA